MATKRCSTCKKDKPLEDFNRFHAGTHGRQANCRECAHAAKKAWRLANVEQDRAYLQIWEAVNSDRKRYLRRRSHLAITYGITPELYDELLERQRGVCLSCGTDVPSPDKRRKNFDVDHDHATGEIRGLLCSPCNLADRLAKGS